MGCGRTACIIGRCNGRVRVIAVGCGRWDCDDCAPRKRAKLVELAVRGRPNILLTLTSRRVEGADANDAAEAMVLAWPKLKQRIERLTGRKCWSVFKVFEATQAGWPHLHVLVRGCFVDQRWLSAQWDELLGAPIVHVKAIDNPGRAANYVAKYLSKAPHQFARRRRWSRSADWCAKIVRPFFDRNGEHWSYSWGGVHPLTAAVRLHHAHGPPSIKRPGFFEFATGPPEAAQPPARELGSRAA